jgi:ATP-dependent RNA helicase DHX8/PRP22
MHQVTVIEPKWLSEVAPTFFRVADHNKISKRKQTEKIEPLFDRFATDKDEWVGPHKIHLGIADTRSV